MTIASKFIIVGLFFGLISGFKFRKPGQEDEDMFVDEKKDESKKKPRDKDYPCDPLIKRVFFTPDHERWEGAEETSELYRELCPGQTRTCCSEEEMLTFFEEYLSLEKKMATLKLLIERSFDLLFRIDLDEVQTLYKKAEQDKLCELPPWRRLSQMYHAFIGGREELESDLSFYINQQRKYYSGLVCGFCKPKTQEVISKTGFNTQIIVSEDLCDRKFTEILRIEGVIRAAFVMGSIAKATLYEENKPLFEHNNMHTLDSLERAIASMSFCSEQKDLSYKKKTKCYYHCNNLMKFNTNPIFGDLNFWLRKNFDILKARFKPVKDLRFKEISIPEEFLRDEEGNELKYSTVKEELYKLRYANIDELPLSSPQEDFYTYSYKAKPYDFDVFEMKVELVGFNPYDYPVNIDLATKIVENVQLFGLAVFAIFSLLF